MDIITTCTETTIKMNIITIKTETTEYKWTQK